MNMVRLATILFMAVFLFGCSFERAKVAQQAKSDLVGMKKVEVISCMGAPSSFIKQDNVEVLTYRYDGDSHSIAMATSIDTDVAIVPMKTARRACIVDLVLTDGVVSRVNYHGRTGGLATQGEQCALLVRNCVRP